jgi:hypothetical protein
LTGFVRVSAASTAEVGSFDLARRTPAALFFAELFFFFGFVLLRAIAPVRNDQEIPI